MATYFFPSCKVTAQFRQASKEARAYVKERIGAGKAEHDHRRGPWVCDA